MNSLMTGAADSKTYEASVKKYWWLNQVTYASEFLARERL